MEYYELIKTVELNVEIDAQIKRFRVELLQSNISAGKYRAKLMEITDYNLYPSIINTGSKGEDLQHCHSADRIWRELPAIDDELYMGFISESENSVLNKAISALLNYYESA